MPAIFAASRACASLIWRRRPRPATSPPGLCDRGRPALFQTLEDLARADAAGDYEQSATLHQRMEELDGYSAERRAEQLLLGLASEKMDAPMSAFSGGWSIRLNGPCADGAL